ncbi:hypothetical protein GCM10010121_022550 [Streptomyces brasiliensis]|uniref:Zinc-binding dehydrogenase n=2 Tax=Streptomyces brasiliensis TaxID=1954 RepID=A0A917NMF5_9ACTN|nr:hypothetical protein GCM10010121_022550 [Streptomyces brasiliensis]
MCRPHAARFTTRGAIPRGCGFGPEEVRAAYRSYESGAAFGKVVIRIA